MTPRRFGSSRETIAAIVSGCAEAFATLALQDMNGWYIEDLVLDQVVSEPFSTAKSRTRACIRSSWISQPVHAQSVGGMTFRGARGSVAYP